LKVAYIHEFLVEYEGLERAVRRRIRKKLDELHRTPEKRFVHQALRGKQLKGLFKLRVGDWRLIYKLDNGVCVFITLGHRSEVYE
jgi:addiction module RelE/StbE family toxin